MYVDIIASKENISEGIVTLKQFIKNKYINLSVK